jgi:hypothetical protein
MRRLVTGVDAGGRSFAASEEQMELKDAGPGLRVRNLFWMRDVPPPPRPPGVGIDHDLGVDPGCVRWAFMDWEAGATIDTPMHHTDTIDLHYVVSGGTQLVLDDGAHELEAGDVVAVTGVDHTWIVGPDGCRLCSFFLGTPPPDAAALAAADE